MSAANPPSGGGGVEAADDGHRRVGLDALDVGQVTLSGVGEVADGGKVVERFGEVFGAGLERPVELDLLVEDLLFEQGGQHDGGRAGCNDARDGVGVTVERRGRGHDRRTQVETEVASGKVDHESSSSS